MISHKSPLYNLTQEILKDDPNMWRTTLKAIATEWHIVGDRSLQFKDARTDDLLLVVIDHKNYYYAFAIQAQAELIHRYNNGLLNIKEYGKIKNYHKTELKENPNDYDEETLNSLINELSDDLNYDIFYIPEPIKKDTANSKKTSNDFDSIFQ